MGIKKYRLIENWHRLQLLAAYFCSNIILSRINLWQRKPTFSQGLEVYKNLV